MKTAQIEEQKVEPVSVLELRRGNIFAYVIEGQRGSDLLRVGCSSMRYLEY